MYLKNIDWITSSETRNFKLVSRTIRDIYTFIRTVLGAFHYIVFIPIYIQLKFRNITASNSRGAVDSDVEVSDTLAYPAIDGRLHQIQMCEPGDRVNCPAAGSYDPKKMRPVSDAQ